MVNFNIEILLRYPLLNPLSRGEARVFTHSLRLGFSLIATFGFEIDILEENPEDRKGAFCEDQSVF
jgi:hypothetical protein